MVRRRAVTGPKVYPKEMAARDAVGRIVVQDGVGRMSAQNQTGFNFSSGVSAGELCHSRCADDEWQPDAEAPACNGCRSAFSMLRRRHHCRKCGKVFCHSCAPRAWVRICGTCKASLPKLSTEIVSQFLAPLCRLLQEEGLTRAATLDVVTEEGQVTQNLTLGDVGDAEARALKRRLHLDAAVALLSGKMTSEKEMRAEYYEKRILWYWAHRTSAGAFGSWSTYVTAAKIEHRARTKQKVHTFCSQSATHSAREPIDFQPCSREEQDLSNAGACGAARSPHRWLDLLAEADEEQQGHRDKNPEPSADGHAPSVCINRAQSGSEAAAVPPELSLLRSSTGQVRSRMTLSSVESRSD